MNNQETTMTTEGKQNSMHAEQSTGKHSDSNWLNESSPLIISHKSLDYHVSVRMFARSGKELRKTLGFKHTFAYVVGILFGSGIFISPSLVARQTSNMGMALIVWIISGIPCIFGALCFCELACMHKKAGGEYLYILEAYGKVASFLAIWAQIIVITPAAVAILALTIGENIVEPFYDVNSMNGIWISKAIAMASVLVSFVINCIGTSFAGKLQLLVTIVQYLAIAFLVVLGVWKLSAGHTENFTNMFDNIKNFEIGSFGLALYNGLWAYDGWGMVTCISEEIQNLERDLWLSIVTGIPVVIVGYIIVNLALMTALTHKEIKESSTVATTFVQRILGRKVSMIIPFAVAFSCFGCVSGSLLIISRAVLSAAREGQLPESLSYIHKNKRTPIPSLFLLSTLTIIWLLALGHSIQGLITYFSFAVWLTYGAAIFSVVLLRIKRPDLHRPFKVWIVNPIFTSCIALFLVVAPFIRRPIESSICLLIMLLGLPIYYIFIKKHDKLPSWILRSMKALNSFLKQRCNLASCIYKDDSNENFVEDEKL